MMIISMVLLLLFSTDGNINRIEGIALLFLLICYGRENIKSARKSLRNFYGNSNNNRRNY